MNWAAATTPIEEPEQSLRPHAVERWRVVFVCVGNSCRSQMAEAWLRHLARERPEPVEVEAESAGISPLGYITRETVEVMEEKQVSLAGQQSKGLEEIEWSRVNVLVNMSPLPGRSVVPGFRGRRLDWKVPDPFNESLRTYRKVRDQLEKKVKELLVELQAPPPGGPSEPTVA